MSYFWISFALCFLITHFNIGMSMDPKLVLSRCLRLISPQALSESGRRPNVNSNYQPTFREYQNSSSQIVPIVMLKLGLTAEKIGSHWYQLPTWSVKASLP
jgi:hypothetical protein